MLTGLTKSTSFHPAICWTRIKRGLFKFYTCCECQRISKIPHNIVQSVSAAAQLSRKVAIERKLVSSGRGASFSAPRYRKGRAKLFEYVGQFLMVIRFTVGLELATKAIDPSPSTRPRSKLYRRLMIRRQPAKGSELDLRRSFRNGTLPILG